MTDTHDIGGIIIATQKRYGWFWVDRLVVAYYNEKIANVRVPLMGGPDR